MTLGNSASKTKARESKILLKKKKKGLNTLTYTLYDPTILDNHTLSKPKYDYKTFLLSIFRKLRTLGNPSDCSILESLENHTRDVRWKSAGELREGCPHNDPNVQRMKATLRTIGIVAAMVFAVSIVYTCCQIGILCLRRRRKTCGTDDLEAVTSDRSEEGNVLATRSRSRSTTPGLSWSGKHNPFKPDSRRQQRARARTFDWRNKQGLNPSAIPVLS